jgi:peptide-methionine (S)-S-oxide reductase
MAVAILAGGCFWGMEALFRRQPGVVKTRVGYTGGSSANPSYLTVKTGATRHAEAIEITYDSDKTDYRNLLEYFFKIHDSTTVDRQGNDRGTQYRSAIFYTDESQKHVAEALIREIDAAGVLPGPIVTEVVPAKTFTEAEDYHQDYLQKNPGGYTCHFVRHNWTLPRKVKAV